MAFNASENAQLPVSTGAGYDLFSNAEYVIQPGCRAVVSTGVTANFPEGTYGHIASRTGLAVKHGIMVLADTIDPDFKDEIKVILHNTDTKRAFVIRQGYRIAHIIFQPYVLLKK
jgi:dUTP pyrophosphatase